MKCATLLLADEGGGDVDDAVEGCALDGRELDAAVGGLGTVDGEGSCGGVSVVVEGDGADDSGC